MRPEQVDPAAVRDGFTVRAIDCAGTTSPPSRSRTAAIAYLGWLGVAELLERSFTDAPVFAFPARCWWRSRSL